MMNRIYISLYVSYGEVAGDTQAYSLLYKSDEIAWIHSKRMTSNPALNDG